MCGICGIVSRNLLSPGDVETVKQMNDQMVHRGPDGAGELATNEANRHVFLAMRRLSIIDLQGGWQPLHNEDQTVSLVVNGEIYNFVELRTDLEKANHRFHTGSDCETLAHLYEDLGLDFVQQLRGMFAFALWDATKRRLVLGRDRMGEKPLYLFEHGETLIFASELRALIASGRVPFALDPASVHEYLHYGWVPEPQTILKGVRKLPAGHLLVVDVDTWRIAESSYWGLLDAPPVEGNPATLIRAELETIAEQMIRSDVPVGVALSGGLDSSVIAALVAKKYPGTLQAFSVGYEGRPRQDERQMASDFAEYLGIPFHQIELSSSEMVNSFHDLNFWRDEPIADIAGFCYYALSRSAKEHDCPVLLQGQGGDELFWGYPWTVRAAEFSIRKQEGTSPNLIQSLLAQVPKGFSSTELVQAAYLVGGVLAGWKKPMPSTAAPEHQLVFYDLNDSFQIGEFGAKSTYTPTFANDVGIHSASAFFQISRPWQRPDLLIFNLLAKSYLLQNGLTQGDRLSMANSVETRLPLVDYKLVELVVGLQKTNPSYLLPEKSWLKAAVQDIVPEWILNRPKRGFNPPVTPWISSIKVSHGSELGDGYLVREKILNRAAIVNLTGQHSRFSAWNDLFFKYMVLESWCQGMTRHSNNLRKTS